MALVLGRIKMGSHDHSSHQRASRRCNRQHRTSCFEESIREGHSTRALVRDPDKARRLPAKADIVVSDVTRPETLSAAVAGIDGIVFTLAQIARAKLGQRPSTTAAYATS